MLLTGSELPTLDGTGVGARWLFELLRRCGSSFLGPGLSYSDFFTYSERPVFLHMTLVTLFNLETVTLSLLAWVVESISFFFFLSLWDGWVLFMLLKGCTTWKQRFPALASVFLSAYECLPLSLALDTLRLLEWLIQGKAFFPCFLRLCLWARIIRIHKLCQISFCWWLWFSLLCNCNV